MYVILTNKDACVTTTNSKGLVPVESYNFLFFGKLKANYTIVEVTEDNAKIQITETTTDKSYVNHIPVKFFDSYGTIKEAQEELQELADPTSEDSKLLKV
jgi:hypothetical protein